MKISPQIFALFSLLLLTSISQAQSGTVDLTTLANYANQPLPNYIGRDNSPVANPITDAGATLGRILFYDKRLSKNNTISCSSCHQQARGFSDTAIASPGVAGVTGRHAMRLINSRFSAEVKFFWNERAASLEAQTTQPIQDHTEMGFSNTLGDPAFADLVTKLSAISEYRVLFAMMFGTAAINETRVQQALAQFVRSIQSFDSRYDTDRLVVQNDGPPFPNFTTSENNGKQLFLAPPPQGGAGCAGCHRPPEFDIDPRSLNNGIIGVIAGGTDLTNTRSPSLRDLVGPGGSSNGAFMHDGSKTTLAAVINHYNAVPQSPANTNLDPRVAGPGGDLRLSTQQKLDLEAFLRTLTGSAVYTSAKWSSPFDASGNLSLIVLPASAMKIVPNGNGTATITCHAAPNLSYILQSSPDMQQWGTFDTLISDASGNLSKVVTMSTNRFYRFAFTPPAS